MARPKKETGKTETVVESGEVKTGKNMVVFYSRSKRQAYCVPVLDKDGKQMIRRNAKGDEVWDGEYPRYLNETKRFTLLSDLPDNTWSFCQVEAGSEDERVLIELAAARDSDVMTAEQYEAISKTPSEKTKYELEESQKMLAAANDRIRDLEAQIAKSAAVGAASQSGE